MRQTNIEADISDREVRTHLGGVRNINVNADTQTSHPLTDITLSTAVSEQRTTQHADQITHDSESLGCSHTGSPDVRTCEIIPQLDGPVSIWSRSRRRILENARIEQESMQRITASHRREYPGESSDDAHSDRRTYRDQRPLEERRCCGHHGSPSDRRYEDGVYFRRGYVNRGGGPLADGRPPDNGGPPDDGGPSDNGGPPGGGGPPGNGRYPRYPGRQEPPGPPGLPGPVRPVIVQTPQVTLDTTALESTFDTMGQSMLQLARAQDQTN